MKRDKFFASFFSKQNVLAKTIGFIVLIATIASCKPEIKETGGQMKYFDLKGYFQADSARLTRKHLLVTKTVVHNGISQTKKLYINNWGQEFDPFISSDINKAAWRDSYDIQIKNNLTLYISKQSELKTKRIVIKRNGDKIVWILILNHTKNLLYESSETLSYIPDSLYQIRKSQHVHLMGQNSYTIKGIF